METTPTNAAACLESCRLNKQKQYRPSAIQQLPALSVLRILPRLHLRLFTPENTPAMHLEAVQAAADTALHPVPLDWTITQSMKACWQTLIGRQIERLTPTGKLQATLMLGVCIILLSLHTMPRTPSVHMLSTAYSKSVYSV